MAELAGLRVAVTGGAGNVGSHLVDACLREGAREVIAIDAFVRGTPENLVDALRTGRAHLVELDVRDSAALREALTGCDVIFHEAALRWTRCQEAPRECYEVIVEGTFNVAEAALATGARRVVLASSALVYGEPRRLPLEEDHPLDGTTIYAAAKIANEYLFRSLQSLAGFRFVVLRYFNVYGPRMDIRTPNVEVMVRWLDLIDSGQPLTLYGDGTQSADFVYIDDVIEANLLALEVAGPAVTVNVCSGVETRMRELASLLLELTGSDVGMTFLPQPGTALARRRFGDPRRAERILAFRAQTPLREGLLRLIQWRAGQLTKSREESA